MLLAVAAMLARDGKVEDATSLLASSSATACAVTRAQLAIGAGDTQQVTHHAVGLMTNCIVWTQLSLAWLMWQGAS